MTRPSILLLLAVVFLLGAGAAAAQADEFVVFRDCNLRTAVASQLVSQGRIPAGSDGTTITPSDMTTLTTLSAPQRHVAQLDGLSYAVNLASLDLHGNDLTAITALGGLANLTLLDVSDNELELAVGSPAMSVIATLQGRGARVSFGQQHARLSNLKTPPSGCSFGKCVTFSASIAPQGAATSGAAMVRLYHLETKSVVRTVKGRRNKVAVNYWRLRRTLTMQPSPALGLAAKGKVPGAGKWFARVVYNGGADYKSCECVSKVFVVQDPRIEAAIRWATRQLGSHTWDHYCLRFVSESYASGARASVQCYDTAKQAARALHAASHKSTAAPRGAWVFYDSTANGHVGISLGNGTMINDYGGAGVKVMRIANGDHYVGWAAPPLSPSIGDWDQAPKL